MTLTIETGVWGNAVDENVQSVFESVVDIYCSIGISVADPIHVVASRGGGPMVETARGQNNRHTVHISEVDKKWDQYAYQFAHEYCHIFSKHELVPVSSRFGWWEESVCELSSLWCMGKMAEQWSHNPPYSNWASYAGKLLTYAERQVENTTTFNSEKNLNHWLDTRLPMLQSNRYMRKHNKVIAKHLLETAEQSPSEFWNAISEMNVNAKISSDLSNYFLGWQNVSNNPTFTKAIAKRMGL